MRRFLVGTGMLVLAGCLPAADPGSNRSDFEKYTSLKLCPGDRLVDRTTSQERDTTPGFSFHIEVQLNRSCAAQFEHQLAILDPTGCGPARLRATGCFIQDVWPHAKKHTTLYVTPISASRYDVRFAE
jgi:hypothetical protein